jgi:hypothetical protein
VVLCLAEAGGNIEERDGDEDTPLHLAACGTDGKGHLDVVEALLECGADPRAQRKNGKTASLTTKTKALRVRLLAAEEAYDESQASLLAAERRQLLSTTQENIEKEKQRREALLAAKRKALAPLQVEGNAKRVVASSPVASPPMKRLIQASTCIILGYPQYTPGTHVGPR